ncbi:MAG: DUF4850 domain-containing protein, partial [Candidatus Dormibacteria bacterium]
TLKASVPPSLTGQVAAYGVAGAVIVGPAGWTGSGAVGADGSSEFTLSPGGTATGSSSAMVFHYDGGCAGCAWEDASAYFTEVAQALPSAEDEEAPSPAAGLQSESLARDSLVTASPIPRPGSRSTGSPTPTCPGPRPARCSRISR